MKTYTLTFAWDPQKDTFDGFKPHKSYLEQIRLQLSASNAVLPPIWICAVWRAMKAS